MLDTVQKEAYFLEEQPFCIHLLVSAVRSFIASI